MKTPLKFVLRTGVYPVKILVWIGAWNEDLVHRFTRKYGYRGTFVAPEEDEGGACYCLGGSSLVWLPWFPRTPADHGFLAHEALHASFNAAKALGFKLSDDSDEFYTYLTGYIVAQVHSRK